ncbi:hypothetical protein BSU04_01020 [Caballeronia sordidicola]|jgi:hypothetical protein|uniref:Uncharacterized protein n=1 Tax=Caballeronia sordidicola TaxID=196367 RepID=A0A226XAM7_CABSO|nr:hypothetical protein BSU04_01020 [Caballeronia sordidicola]
MFGLIRRYWQTINRPSTASALSRHGREDVYRLAQGYCRRIAGHELPDMTQAMRDQQLREARSH